MMILACRCLVFAVCASACGMASKVEVPRIIMNNGKEMPAIALGTYLGFEQNIIVKSQNKQLRDIVRTAVDVGYRHFDTATIYETEEEVGEGIRMKIEEGVIGREDVFITTKLWNTQHKREQVASALRDTLQRLGLNYVDLYLIHWPIGLNADYTHSDVDYMETWRGMEDVQKLGLAKSIGVSNFNKQQIERILREGEIKPAALQIEIHPQIIQAGLLSFAKSEAIVVMGYSPFGSMVSRFGKLHPGPRIDDLTLVDIAKKYGKTTPQVVLRWLVDRSVVPVPKTVNPKRLEENINIFDFKLETEEINQINQYDSHTRYTRPSFWQNHRYYPFEKIENPIDDPFIKV